VPATRSDLGFDAAARDRLLGRTTPVPPSRDVLAQAAAVMLGPAGLTARCRCSTGATPPWVVRGAAPAAHRRSMGRARARRTRPPRSRRRSGRPPWTGSVKRPAAQNRAPAASRGGCAPPAGSRMSCASPQPPSMIVRRLPSQKNATVDRLLPWAARRCCCVRSLERSRAEHPGRARRYAAPCLAGSGCRRLRR
jgi:hypothetical protein